MAAPLAIPGEHQAARPRDRLYGTSDRTLTINMSSAPNSQSFGCGDKEVAESVTTRVSRSLLAVGVDD